MSVTNIRIIKAADYNDLSKQAANLLASQITLKPDSVLGLATGSTPIGAYKKLIRMYENGDVDFSGISSVNLDEYCGLTEDNEQSYRYFMNSNLFNHVNIDKSRTYIPNGATENPTAESQRYDEFISKLGGVDLQLLGLGHNGHIGFNEPCDEFIIPTHVVELSETTIEANTRFFASRDEVPKRAITMGIGTIMTAKKILLIVNGKDKADIINKVLYGPVTPEVPASVLRLHTDVTVIMSVE